MKETLTQKQVDDILKAIDKAIDQGPWESSNFLRVIGKNLRKIRDDYAAHIKGSSKQPQIESNIAKRIALRSGKQEIFISLYSSEGSSLQTWERLLSNLPNQVISRPIYASENDVIHFIKSKENKMNEAYVSVYINSEDILNLAAEKIPTDKLGKPLLSLKDKAIHLEDIGRFVHMLETFHLVKGRLVPV